MVSVLGKAQAEKHDRRFQVLLHRDNRSDRTAFANESGCLAESGAHGVPGGVGVGSIDRPEKRLQERFRQYLSIGTALLDEITGELENLGGILIGNQSH